jgi:inosine-uridine nucleoside N-ribohydrolase
LALIEIFREHKDATPVCIGALTNTALAIKLDSEFASWPKEMVIMGGNIHGINFLNYRSFKNANF